MCNAFSCLITRDRKVLWKAGIDSHSELVSHFKLDDTKKELDADFVKVELTPVEGYLHPEGKWTPKIDQGQTPHWWKDSMLMLADSALEKWKQEVYSKFDLEAARNPVKPWEIEPAVGAEEMELLERWASVWDSVGGSVRDSVGDSVRDSVWASVRASVRDSVWASVRDSVGGSVWASVGDSVWGSVGDSVRDSVWGSVRDSVGDSVRDSVWASVRASVGGSVWASVRASVWAYIGSLFTGITEWKYTEGIKGEGYPFQPTVDLWKKGLIPTTDGKFWYLYHPVKEGKAKVMWKGEL